MSIDTMNPEDMFSEMEEHGIQPSADFILDGKLAKPTSEQLAARARNVAKLLIDSEPLAIAQIISDLMGENIPPEVNKELADILTRKVMESTPDKLSQLVIDARQANVWHLVKPYVLQRNKYVADHLRKYTNVAAIKEFFETVATIDTNWLPGPIYDAGIFALGQATRKADMKTLDEIADLSREWAMPQGVLPYVRTRQSELIREIEKYAIPGGYPMRKDKKSVLVEKPVIALRMACAGYEFIER